MRLVWWLTMPGQGPFPQRLQARIGVEGYAKHGTKMVVQLVGKADGCYLGCVRSPSLYGRKPPQSGLMMTTETGGTMKKRGKSDVCHDSYVLYEVHVCHAISHPGKDISRIGLLACVADKLLTLTVDGPGSHVPGQILDPKATNMTVKRMGTLQVGYAGFPAILNSWLSEDLHQTFD